MAIGGNQKWLSGEIVPIPWGMAGADHEWLPLPLNKGFLSRLFLSLQYNMIANPSFIVVCMRFCEWVPAFPPKAIPPMAISPKHALMNGPFPLYMDISPKRQLIDWVTSIYSHR